jgi:hypothetical protein
VDFTTKNELSFLLVESLSRVVGVDETPVLLGRAVVVEGEVGGEDVVAEVEPLTLKYLLLMYDQKKVG